MAEQLEARRTLSSIWQNPLLGEDIDRDGTVSAGDVLLLVGDINTHGSRQLPLAGAPPPFLDANGDGFIAATDVLLVVDLLNSDQPQITIGRNSDDLSVTEGSTWPDAAPARQDWGVNLNSNVDWATMGTWVDISKMFRQWGDVDNPWEAGAFTLPLTSQGIPQEDFGTIIANEGGIGAGVYTLQYAGTATVVAAGGWQIIPGSVHSSGSLTTLQIQVSEMSDLTLSFYGVTQLDPVRNIKMVSNEYGIDSTKTFGDAFLRRLQPFSTLRFMDWNQTNNSTASLWSDRRLPRHTIQTVSRPGTANPAGVAWEYMIQLANETQKDAWINVPHAADDDYVRQLARLWRDQLDPQLTLYVEWSNESWNSNFSQSGENGHDYYLAGNAGPQTVRIAQIFREEFGSASDRLHVTLAGQAANRWVIERGLQYMRDQGLVPAEVIDSISIAPYFSIPENSTASTLDQLFAELTQRTTDIQNHSAIAATEGVALLGYEGGQHLAPYIHSGVDPALLAAAQHDPRMAQAYRDFTAAWAAAGGGLFHHFAFIEPDTQSGHWSLLTSIDEPGDTKWDAALGMILQPGDANLDGAVDMSDFEILAVNFGQTGIWWEQGDFDGNNIIDGADLEWLYANASFTPTERDQVLDFAAARKIPLFDRYTLALPSIPTAPVSVTIQSTAGLTLSQTSITFAPDATSLRPQTIYVAAQDDLVIEGDHYGIVTHVFSSEDPLYDGIRVPGVLVQIQDP